MGLSSSERWASGFIVDEDGRLIVVGPGGQPITGGGGGVSGPVDVTDRAGRVLGSVTVENPVSSVQVSNLPVTQPVSGIVSVGNFPASQPVTGPLTDAQLRASPVPVSGFPAVQPARDVKDTGRTYVVLSVAGVASVTAETFLNLNANKGGAATTGTTYTVPAGKTLRLQAIQFGARFATMSTTATFANVTFRIRLGSATSSPLLLSDSKAAASNAATPNSDLAIPDGLELPAGSVLGVTQQASATTLLLDAILVGFEY